MKINPESIRWPTSSSPPVNRFGEFKGMKYERGYFPSFKMYIIGDRVIIPRYKDVPRETDSEEQRTGDEPV